MGNVDRQSLSTLPHCRYCSSMGRKGQLLILFCDKNAKFNNLVIFDILCHKVKGFYQIARGNFDQPLRKATLKFPPFLLCTCALNHLKY